jgi:hypothetical protein
MSANTYTVESLLVGKTYYSGSVTGEIISAEKNNDVWYSESDTYLVEISPRNFGKNTYRYLAVKTGE